MIIFKKINFQNFLSYGNAPTEISLNSVPVTYISGKNGAGKSTCILDTICFALYNRAFRDIAKGTVVNSINTKNCRVELHFQIGTKEYVVVRGMKPNIFEIHENGVLLNQDAATKDYQKILEDQILKLNYKSFTQLVILGSASYVPFMQLSAGDRRTIIEDLLDIKVFTAMKKLLKEQNDAVVSEKKDTETQIEINREKVWSRQRYIESMQKNKESERADLESSIAMFEEEIIQIDTEIATYIESRTALYEKTTAMADVTDKKSKIVEYKKQYQYQIREQEKEIKFFRINDNCPTCTQPIDVALKEQKLGHFDAKVATLQEGIQKADVKLEKIEKQYNDIVLVLNEIRELDGKIGALDKKKSQNVWQIDVCRKEILKRMETVDTENEQREISELEAKIIQLQDKNDILIQQIYNYKVCAELLKDTGIKSNIIKKYVPILNHFINYYLQELDFYVNFTLDESFGETIKARHRDLMKYQNFSEGEKQRINLAVLFAFRKISESKNTCNTNLLIFDELFSSSMDTVGTDAIVKLLDEMGDRNIFIVSHTISEIPEKWRHLRAEKVGNFSVIEEISG